MAFAGGLDLTIRHSIAIGIGLLIDGIVLIVIEILLIVSVPEPGPGGIPGPFLTRQPGLSQTRAHRTPPGVEAGHRRRDFAKPAGLRWSCDAGSQSDHRIAPDGTARARRAGHRVCRYIIYGWPRRIV